LPLYTSVVLCVFSFLFPSFAQPGVVSQVVWVDFVDFHGFCLLYWDENWGFSERSERFFWVDFGVSKCSERHFWSVLGVSEHFEGL